MVKTPSEVVTLVEYPGGAQIIHGHHHALQLELMYSVAIASKVLNSVYSLNAL